MARAYWGGLFLTAISSLRGDCWNLELPVEFQVLFPLWRVEEGTVAVHKYRAFSSYFMIREI